MPESTVCAVMLVNGRPEMTRKAIESFRAQTYNNKQLLILDTTPKGSLIEWTNEPNETQIWHYHPRENKSCDKTIGALRNKANSMCLNAEILCHWDSDDIQPPAPDRGAVRAAAGERKGVCRVS